MIRHILSLFRRKHAILAARDAAFARAMQCRSRSDTRGYHQASMESRDLVETIFSRGPK